MTTQTINYLEDLKNGETFFLTKDRPNEIYQLVINLKNLGLLYKSTKFGYSCDYKNRKYLAKLIELKSWSDFLNWLDEQNTNSDIINDFSGSTIGQVNQLSSEKFTLKSPITQNIIDETSKKTNKKSWLEIASWAIGIIAGGIAIYEFIIKSLLK
ncbi:MAG: hypothetical protein REI96_10550 [Flavobacterium nitrogenifigens]|uniref:hypothetical protein n=1 Tax=Flavobacterium nitrogenifigens TaxID=1617283 RepID=UPI002806CDFA|nr:hypothetical protein [Flavobacterium nitrogenifigens]MDQ8012878.1 hypothetical protein [Flavobacterium nitrogenifigens]